MFVNDVYGNKLPVWTLDFETFFEDNRKGYSLRNPNINTIMYIRDPRFKAHGISVIEPDDKEYWVTHSDLPYFFKELKKQQIAMLVQNGFFDPLIASEHYDFFPAYILDTMCMSLGEWGPNERHNLEAITQRLELEGKLKGILELTSGIRDLPSEIEEQLIPYALQDSRATKQVFRKLYLDRGYPEKELHIIDITLKAATRPLLRLDAGLCRAEIEEEDRRIQLLLQSNVIGSEALSTTCAKKLASEGIEGLMRSRPCFAELLTARGIVPPMKHAKTAQGEYKYDEDGNPVYTWAFAKNDLELQALADDERVSDLVSLWTGLKSTIRKTRAETFLKTTHDGTKTLPVPLKYYGARTGRWSGLEGLNMQNLTSGRDGRGSRLRQSILAPEGYKIIAVDSSAIEVRCNAWLWGQTDVLDIFRGKKDPYCTLASELYGVPVEKKGLNAHLRPVGKAMRLGLGYGMGWKKFLDGCLSGSIIGEVVQMTAPEAQRAVEKYRASDLKIVEGWQQCSNAIRLMSAKMAGYWLNDFLYVANDRIILPNELCIHYKNLTPRYDPKTGYVETVYQTGVDKEFNPIWTRIYGPKMVENIVQALARIIVAEQAVEISKRYPIVLLVHDEVVYLAPEKEADEALQFGLECMRTPLSWCPDIPLDAEGGHDYCYSK